MSNKTPDNSTELTREQIIEGQTKLRDLIAATGQNEGITQDELEATYYSLARDPELIKLLASGQDQQAQDRLRKLTEDLKLKTLFAVATLEDGSEKPLTGATLLALMQRGLDEEKPDAEAADKLKFLLGSMLDYAATQKDLLSDPVTAKTLDAMRTIFEYLQQGIESVEELDKFFREQTEFMAIPRPAGIEDFLSINAGKGSKEITLKDFANTKITFEGRLAIDEQKINEMIRLAFASSNPYKAKTGLNTLIELPFTDTMEILGRAQTERNRKEFSRQLRKEMLPAIAHQHIDIKATDGSFIHMEIGGGYFAVNVRKDKIYFKISEPYAAYLNAGALSQYSSKTLRLGSQKKPLPFYLAIKLQDQYFHDGNRKRKDKQGNPQPTNNILAIKTLLNFCADNIPSYEYVQQTDRGHWVRQIRQPLEEALNEIQSAGLFSWQYCKRGLAEATPQEIRTNDYRKWSSLYITFRLIPDEPDQTERLEHKQERLEAAQAKQALKDAETLIKADKIEKRKARQQKKSSTS